MVTHNALLNLEAVKKRVVQAEFLNRQSRQTISPGYRAYHQPHDRPMYGAYLPELDKFLKEYVLNLETGSTSNAGGSEQSRSVESVRCLHSSKAAPSTFSLNRWTPCAGEHQSQIIGRKSWNLSFVPRMVRKSKVYMGAVK
jgi:hypothetical protein